MDAGWYEDPSDPSRMRFWDGERWTELYDGGGSGEQTGEPDAEPAPEWGPHGPRGWYPDLRRIA